MTTCEACKLRVTKVCESIGRGEMCGIGCALKDGWPEFKSERLNASEQVEQEVTLFDLHKRERLNALKESA